MRAGLRRVRPPLALATTLATLATLATTLATLATLAIIAVPPTATRAAPAPVPGPGITMTVQPGYEFSGGGTYRLNGPSLLRANDVWVPVHITLHNGTGSDATPRLVIHDNGPQTGNGGNGPVYRTDYKLDVALPAGGQKAVTMYVRADDIGAQLTLDMDVGGTVVTTANMTPALQQGGALSVGVLSDDTATRTIFRSIKLGDTALSVAQFADATPLDQQAQALETFDLIVVSNYSSDGLTGAQAAALHSWVQQGGTLVVAGGPDAQKTMGHFPADLLAATARSTTLVPAAPELARIAGDAVPASGPVELSVASPRPGARVLATHNGIPLAVDLPLGRGHLVYSALEPTLAPLNTWPVAAQGDFWGRLLAPSLAGPLDALVQNSMQSPQQSFPAPGNPATPITGDLLPTRTLPSLQLYSILIVLYIVALGPLNFIVLRWRRRLEWSWVTIPAVAALFGVGSFGLAYARNGGEVVANVDTVVYLDPGGATKLADSYIGVFAPFQGDYTLSTPGAALAWSLGGDTGSQAALSSGHAVGLRVDEGAQLNAQMLGLQMWSMRTIGVRQQLALSGQVTGRLVIQRDSVSGTVTNGTGLTLHDCAVVSLNGASRQIRTIGPHETVPIPTFSLGNLGSSVGTGGPSGNVGPLTDLYGAPSGAGQVPNQGANRTARYANVLNAVFTNGSVATGGAPLALVGWSTQPLGRIAVNGATPRRDDLDLIIAPLGAELAPGRFNLAPGDLPVAVVGTTVAPNTGSNNGLTLNAGDHLDVQLMTPGAGGRVQAQTLTLQVSPSNGSSLSQTGTQVRDWSTGQWKTVDLSTGPVTLRHAARYVSPDGRVTLRVQAPQGNSLSFDNVEQNVAIGVAGVAQ